MPTRRLPIIAPTSANVPDSAVDTGSARIVNGYLIDSQNGVEKRKGYKQWTTALDSNKGSNGIFWWDDKDKVLTVSGDTVHDVSTISSPVSVGTATESDPGARQFYTFTKGIDDTETTNAPVVFIGGFETPVYTDGNTVTEMVTATYPNMPTNPTHVVYIDGYLLVNSLSSTTNRRRIYYNSNPGEVAVPASWQGEFFSAESDSDYVMAMHELNGDLVVWGTNSIERFYNDGVTPWRRYDNVNVGVGTLNPYTIAKVDNGFIFMDNKRRIVFYGGGEVEVLSEPIDRQLERDQLGSAFSDSDYIDTNKVFAHNGGTEPFGFYMEAEGKHLYVITYPTYTKKTPDDLPTTNNGRTFVYDVKLKAWYEWGEWDASSKTYTRWTPSCGAFRASNGEMHLGAYSGAETFVYGDDAIIPHTEAGGTIRFEYRSPHVDDGIYNTKRYNRLRMHLEDKSTFNVSNPRPTGTITLGWIDDGVEYFEVDDDLTANKSATISYSMVNDDVTMRMANGNIVEQRNMGMGRRRQWNVVHEENANLVINLIEEDADVMTN